MENLIKLPLHPSVKFIKKNSQGLIALNKGVGVLSHPNRIKDQGRSLLDARYNPKDEVYFWEDESGNILKVWLLNRLDSPTSGVIILSQDEALSVKIKEAFHKHRIKKTYHAIVKGSPRLRSGIWCQKLNLNPYNKVKSDSLISAKTRYDVVRNSKKDLSISFLKLEPITGRTHQLRIHCSQNNIPIVGDQTYGDFKFNRSMKKNYGVERLLLHSSNIELNYNWSNKVVQFSAKAELPDSFNQLIV